VSTYGFPEKGWICHQQAKLTASERMGRLVTKAELWSASLEGHFRVRERPEASGYYYSNPARKKFVVEYQAFLAWLEAVAPPRQA